jgi:hypothetical protein
MSDEQMKLEVISEKQKTVDEKLDEEMKVIEQDLKPGASMVKLGEDGFLKVIIDLNVPGELFIETRVGAFGTIAWAQELASRWIMQKEMMLVKNKAIALAEKEKRDKELGILPVGSDWKVKK